jgi:hypothetical protein
MNRRSCRKFSHVKPASHVIAKAPSLLVHVLAHHGPEKMLGMLIAVLRFDVVPIEHGRASKGKVAFVLSLGVGDQMLAATIAGKRPCHAGTWCGAGMVRPLSWPFWKALRHFDLFHVRGPLFSRPA